jgi:hypothetical protein
MENIVKNFLIRLAIMTFILYGVTIPIYFLHFHKPHELLPEKLYNGEADQWAIEKNIMYKSWDHDEIVNFCILAFMVCLIVSLIIVIVYSEIEYYIKPVITVEAVLKSKETNGSMAGDPRSGSVPSYRYYLIFETDEGVEMVFPVGPQHYVTLFEGNKGILKYKKGITERFVGFDITAIE